MDLYTSLVRLKQSMNNGSIPPMTPIPVESCDLIDPAFTIGYGALTEDPERGLRCPLRGCGLYFHRLSAHIVRSHKSTSLREVCAKLSIPQTAQLVSRSEHERSSVRASSLGAVRRIGDRARTGRPVKHRESRRAASRTVGAKNLLDSCPTQLSHKIIDLHHRLRRTPSGREANATYGEGFTTAVLAVYGSWNNAIAQCGLDARRKSRKYDTHDVLEGLRAYYAQHGALPTSSIARYGNRAPLLCSVGSILRAFNVTSWTEAMRIAASMLDIRGGRYGLPERRASTETAA